MLIPLSVQSLESLLSFSLESLGAPLVESEKERETIAPHLPSESVDYCPFKL